MDERDIFDSRAMSLAQILSWVDAEEELWAPGELEAIFKHQLSAPLASDLGELGPEQARHLERLCSASSPPIQSFRDLLLHPCPPVELLRMTKDFAKRCRNHPDCRLPDEIATMLYILSIVVALTKGGHRMTRLDGRGLRHTVDWALSQPWVDASMRELLKAGCLAIDREEPQADV